MPRAPNVTGGKPPAAVIVSGEVFAPTPDASVRATTENDNGFTIVTGVDNVSLLSRSSLTTAAAVIIVALANDAINESSPFALMAKLDSPLVTPKP